MKSITNFRDLSHIKRSIYIFVQPLLCAQNAMLLILLLSIICDSLGEKTQLMQLSWLSYFAFAIKQLVAAI